MKDLIAKSNADIVVVDAEILLQAGWDEDGTVNQVWSCIVPPESAVERMIERDKLTTEEVGNFKTTSVSILEIKSSYCSNNIANFVHRKKLRQGYNESFICFDLR